MKKNFFQSDVTLDDLKSIETTRFQSYQETKNRRISMWIVDPIGAESELVSQRTISEVDKLVGGSVEKAKERLLDRPELVAIIDHLENSWNKAKNNFLVLSTGLHSLLFLSEVEVERLLLVYAKETNQQNGISWLISNQEGNC